MRSLFPLGLIGAAILLLGIARPMFTRTVYTDTDLGNFHLPFRAFYAESLEKGEGFIWCPYEYSGFYLHGEGQAALYHPLNWLSYRFLPLDIAFDFELLRNYVFLLIGSYFFFRRWRKPRAASIFGAILFSFCGFNTVHFMHLNLLAIVAHLPFALVAIDVAMRSEESSKRALGVAALALLCASQLLFGHPQTVLIGLVGEGAYISFLLWSSDRWLWRSGRWLWRSDRWRRLAWLLPAYALAPLLAAVQLIPQWEALLDSRRAAPGAGFALSLALHPWNLAQLFAPLLFESRSIGQAGASEFLVYDGAVMPLLLAWLWVRRRQLGSRRTAVVFALITAGIAVILALGARAELYRLLASLPLMRLFRGPARFMLLFHGASAVLAALAFSDLTRWSAAGRCLPWRRMVPIGVPIVLSVSIATGALLARGFAPHLAFAQSLSGLLRIAVGPALFAAATGLLVAAARGHPRALAVLVLFTVCELAFFAWGFVGRTPAVSIEYFAQRWPALQAQQTLRLRWAPPSVILRHVRLASGYVAMEPRRRLPLHVHLDPLEPAANPSLIAALRVAGIARAYGHPVPDPLSRVRLLARALRTRALERQLGQIDVKTTALVDRDLSLSGAEPGSARLLVDRPGDIRVETRSVDRQLLVLSESYHRGWRAQLDATSCQVVRVYGDYMGCVVSAGTHRVRFLFDPPSLRIGERVSLASLVPLGLLYLLAARPRRRKSR